MIYVISLEAIKKRKKEKGCFLSKKYYTSKLSLAQLSLSANNQLFSKLLYNSPQLFCKPLHK